jgi:GNAT superfamily N-acetyltransferase
MPDIEVVTTGERHDLDDEARSAFHPTWPQFVFHDQVTPLYIERVEEYFPYYDVILLEEGHVVAGAWAVPLRWNGQVRGLPDRGYDSALINSVTGHENGEPADTLCIMAAAVRADRQRTGLAGQALTALRERAVGTGLRHVIAPVRPALKSKYPITSMDSFARWMRDDGLHIDPWIRTHQRLGATILGPAPEAMTITAAVAEWEQWTDMAFPESGRYVVPDALDPIDIDRDQDRGTYEETNLWMQHL